MEESAGISPVGALRLGAFTGICGGTVNEPITQRPLTGGWRP